MNRRLCYRCEQHKDEADFIIPSDVKSGRRRNTCNECRIKQIRSWADTNRSQVNLNQRNYNKSITGKVNSLYHGAETRSASKGKPILITKDEIRNALIAGYCQRTYLPFTFSNMINGVQNPMSPSIDKIDPNGLYEPSNVQYVCWWYNIAKQKWTDEFVIYMAKQLTKVSI